MKKMYKSLQLLFILLSGAFSVSFAQTSTYSSPGGPYYYTVPAGVTGITVNVKGGAGGMNSDVSDTGGYGGCVQAIIAVTPGQQLVVYVGGRGGNATLSAAGAGGINQGGDGGADPVDGSFGGGGGGFSDIRLIGGTLADRIVIAGGGGGAGDDCGGNSECGGAGGPSTGGQNGYGCGGALGYGFRGALGVGGLGGVCGTCSGSAGSAGGAVAGGAGGVGTAGGGGGAGYGGGGGGQFEGAGGGGNFTGGSSVMSVVSDSRGCSGGDGSVAITASCRSGIVTGPDSVCVSYSATTPLTETVSGGTWSSSNPAIGTVSSGGIIYGVAPGPDTIIYTVGSFCATRFPIVVNPLPSPITIPGGTFFVCQHDTITLADATSGGTWVSTAPTIASIGTGTGFVTGVNPGTSVIYYTLTATGCRQFQSINIGAVPDSIVGPDSACVGGTVVLADLTSSGVWVSTNPAVATVGSTTGFVTAVSSTPANTTTINYVVAGCKASVVFTVNPNPTAITGPATICMGTTGTETSTPGGGVWTVTAGSGSASIGSTSGVITPLTVGSVTVTYTLSTGCTQSRIVTILAAPLPISTTSSGVECAGTATITLTDGTSGGTWSSLNTTQATITGGGVVTALGTASGIDTIEYTAAGCYALYIVTINPKPAAIAATSTSICVGDCSEVFSDPTTPGTWSTSAPAIGSIDASSGDFCALTAGTLTVTYTLSVTGCTRNRAVTVNPLPAAISSAPAIPSICLGSTTINLSDATAGGTWSSTNVNTTISGTTGSPITVTGVSTGTDTVTYTSAAGCTTYIVVTVNTSPNPVTAPDSNFCQGQTVTVTSPGSGAGTWSSTNPGAATVGSATGIVVGAGGGVSEIVFTSSATNCTSQLQVTVNSSATITAPSNLCAVAPTYTVTASGGAGNWSSTAPAIATCVNSSTPPAGLLTPVSAGVDSVCFTLVASGCRACVPVTIDAVPPAIGHAGGLSVCTGNTINLTETVGGTWSASNGSATVGSSTGIVTGVTSAGFGSADTITFSTGAGCNATAVVTVNQSPAAITGVTTTCQGLTSTLSTTGPTGFGWNWVSSATGVATVVPAGGGGSATVHAVSSGTTTITYSNSTTGCSTSVIFTVTSFTVTPTGPSIICMGSAATVTETVAGTWASLHTGIATVVPGPATSTVVTPVAAGLDTLTFTDPAGCEVSKPVTVNVVPLAIVVPLGSLNLCPGGFVELTASTGAGYTYQWFNGGAIAGATNSTYNATSAGSYDVVVSNGVCAVTSVPDAVTMNPVTATIVPTGPLSTCISSPVTLDGYAGAPLAGYTYQWLLNDTTIAGAVASTYTPTVSGTYSVLETNSFGCTGTTSTLTVTLNPAPAGVVSASGLLNFCLGGSVTLTGDAGAGYTYQWYNGGLGTPIIGATDMTYTATTTGNYFVVDFNVTGCSTTSATSAVVVSPLPYARITAATDTIFCSGGAVALAAPAVAGNQFQWYDNGTAIAGATSAVYVAGTTGTYTVRVDSPSSGCSSLSPGMEVTVVSTPVIHPITPTSFCWGSSADLAVVLVSGAGTVGYQWTLAGANIAGATNSTYNATTSGLYGCVVTVGAGVCTTTSFSVSIVEYPLPNPFITYDGTNLHAQIYYADYIWYFNGAVMSAPSVPTVSPIGNGTYKVKVIDSNGCQQISTGFIVTGWVEHPAFVAGVHGADISIYPNPATSVLHVESPVAVRATIYSIDGRVVLDVNNATDIDISRIASGIYTIKLFGSDGTLLKADKIVKE